MSSIVSCTLMIGSRTPFIYIHSHSFFFQIQRFACSICDRILSSESLWKTFHYIPLWFRPQMFILWFNPVQDGLETYVYNYSLYTTTRSKSYKEQRALLLERTRWSSKLSIRTEACFHPSPKASAIHPGNHKSGGFQKNAPSGNNITHTW